MGVFDGSGKQPPAQQAHAVANPPVPKFVELPKRPETEPAGMDSSAVRSLQQKAIEKIGIVSDGVRKLYSASELQKVADDGFAAKSWRDAKFSNGSFYDLFDLQKLPEVDPGPAVDKKV